MTIVEALKDLANALGGLELEGTTKAECIEELANGIENGDITLDTAELPEVSADDNGKVLMVVDGAWAVASIPTEETVTEPNS